MPLVRTVQPFLLCILRHWLPAVAGVANFGLLRKREACVMRGRRPVPRCLPTLCVMLCGRGKYVGSFAFRLPSCAKGSSRMGLERQQHRGDSVEEATSIVRAVAAVLAGLEIIAGVSWPLDSNAMTPPPAASAPSVAATVQRGLLEETWDFTNKFYLDRSHNHQDWAAVRDTYRARVAANRGDERALTKDMLQLLGDRYTRLVSPEAYSALSKFDMLGAGVMLSPNKEGQLAVASSPAPGSAAAAKGVRKGDLVTAINGRPTVKMTSFDVIDFLSKYQGSTVSFTLRSAPGGDEQGAAAAGRGGGGEEGLAVDRGGERTVELARTFQQVKNPVEYSLQENDGHKVGYMAVSEFNSVATDRVRSAVQELLAEGADEFVLDLRGNGGGAFQSALGLAGLFMDDSPITYVVDGDGKRIAFNTQVEALTDAPLVVWIDGGSASASEVLAGALHDDCRAVLVGQRSFGKGLIQAVYGLGDGSGLVVTVARYQTPRGIDIQGTGIAPDVEVPWPSFLPSVGRRVPQVAFELAVNRMRTCPPIVSPDVTGSAAAAAKAAAPAS